MTGPLHLVEPLDLLQRPRLGDGHHDVPDLVWRQPRRVGGRPRAQCLGVSGQRLSRNEGLCSPLDLPELVLALLRLKQRLGRLLLLQLDFLEVENLHTVNTVQ